ncbi:MAG: hypothetical protein IH591_09895 [Bacteroidales bacterium]|nr:hypothetical protein [Bacteroidales bacterium]
MKNTPLFLFNKNSEMEICSYCGSNRIIVNDHKIAKINGGVSTIPACSTCNSSKGKKAVMEWFRWLKANDWYRWNRIAKFHARRRGYISQKVHTVRDE